MCVRGDNNSTDTKENTISGVLLEEMNIEVTEEEGDTIWVSTSSAFYVPPKRN